MSPLPPFAARAVLYLSCFLVAAVFRFLLLVRGFPNDHFVYITGGWQWLSGEWPTRDWVDGGAPLMLALSASAQALFGSTLFAEGVLVAAAFGLGAALTSAVVVRWTGSLSLAAGAALLEIAIVPRTYSHPKVLIYALAFLGFAALVRRPTMGRHLGLAVIVVAAFLLRHDHGVVVGAGALLTVWLSAPEPPGGLTRRRAVITLLAAVGALLLAYLLYVQWFEGVWTHAGIGLAFGQREMQTQWGVLPHVWGDARPLRSMLFYWYYLIPVAAAALALRRSGPDAARWRAMVLPVASVAMLLNLLFLREPLPVRLPDPIVPAVVLGAWLSQQALAARRRRLLTTLAAAASVVVFSASVLAAGETREAIDQAGLRRWWNVPHLLVEQATALRARLPERVWPSRASASLVPFYGYLDRCTTAEHRLLIGGFLVEVPFFARRRFAGGQRYFGGSYGFDQAAERLAMARLDRQVTPFAIVPSDYAPSLEEAFPLLARRLRQRYRPLAEVPVTAEQQLRIYVDAALPVRAIDAGTGWPCFR